METIEVVPGQVLRLPLDLVMPDPNNPRKDFDEDALQDLAEDIKLRGVEQPITVYPIGAGFFRIKLGERRYRASKLAGMDTIPALVAGDNPDEAPELDRLLDQVKENCLRKDLTPIEWGLFFKRLREDFHLQVKEIPEMLEQRGMKRISRSYISNFMRLTELPDWATALIASGKVPASYGKHLLVGCESPLVEEELRQAFEADDGDEDEPFFDNERHLERVLHNFFEQHHPRLDRRCSQWDEKQPLYRAADLDDGDRAELRVRVVGGTEFVLNLEEHERRQKAAKEAGAKPATSSFIYPGDGEAPALPERTRAPERKKPALPGDERISDYLSAWLRAHIISTVFDQQIGGKAAAEDLARRLVAWSAFHRPTPLHHMGTFSTDESPGRLLVGVAQELGLETIGAFLTDNVEPSHMYERVARALVERMCESNLMLLSVWLGIDIEKVYVVDDDYLQLHTKSGLEKLTKDCKLKASSWWTSTAKLAEMHGACLSRASEFGLPPQLRKEWERRMKDRNVAKFRASLARDTPAADASDKKPKPVRIRKQRAKKGETAEASTDVA